MEKIRIQPKHIKRKVAEDILEELWRKKRIRLSTYLKVKDKIDEIVKKADTEKIYYDPRVGKYVKFPKRRMKYT